MQFQYPNLHQPEAGLMVPMASLEDVLRVDRAARALRTDRFQFLDNALASRSASNLPARSSVSSAGL
jgi:hypothetical protein